MMPSRVSAFFEILKQKVFAVLSVASGQMSAPGPEALAPSVFERVTEADAPAMAPFEDMGRKKKHPTRKLAICTLGFSELQKLGLRLPGQAAPLKHESIPSLGRVFPGLRLPGQAAPLKLNFRDYNPAGTDVVSACLVRRLH